MVQELQIFRLHPLFEDVQLQNIFNDSKTFVDCIPVRPLTEIQFDYSNEKDKDGFDLKSFVLKNFNLPEAHANNFTSDTDKSVEENINLLWPVLTRQPAQEQSTLIPLPHPYIVPGGRFGEIYYWDSFFTMLGLKASGRIDMIENMVNNFSFLIDELGFIPNGNRQYYSGRSQPPFYSLMIKLLASIKGENVILNYLKQLEKEYDFWMKGNNDLVKTNNAIHRVVLLPDGEMLNRYWDEFDAPRPESYREDIHLAKDSGQNKEQVYRDLRAGAESGWDYSSRWFKDKNDFVTIHTTEIIPVDLNCLLFHLEQIIAKGYQLKNNSAQENKYRDLAANRKAAIQKYLWNKEAGFFFDYDWKENCQKTIKSLAGVFPLYFQIANTDQANKIATVIENDFLNNGGVTTTLNHTGQQWDAPNGWAPLQWMTITGLENYGHNILAKTITERWIKLNTDVFKRTGKLMEKYNVVDTQLEAGGGEYPGQDGFGWTNGVLLALIKKYGFHLPVF